MTKKILVLIIPLFIFGCKVQQRQVSNKNTNTSYIPIERREYIKTFNSLAIKEMKRSRIPASITLAQALLESDNGNSTLATKANNHFGIKCHSSWSGPKVFHDDDKRNECFRKYRSVYDSYKNHSDFIANGDRYQFLFNYKTTDYKSWAKGLQKAGYATSRTYATMLIKIIEDNKLYDFDSGKEMDYSDPVNTGTDSLEFIAGDVDNFTISINKHKVYNQNRIDYIIVKKGDTYKAITEEFGMLPFEIYKYNELNQPAKISEGQILYLQPKRNKAGHGLEYHTVEAGETMYLISQKYGVKLNKLYEKNLMEKGDKSEIGKKLWLRNIKTHQEAIDETPVIEGFDK
ncbi:MAG: glucosaminidase domain-containing protein [Bacteroidales bacterium]|nr:glucosaminidase domain-containing protein [Bacteroidales bacterium]